MAVLNIEAEDLAKQIKKYPEEIELIDVREKGEFVEVRLRGAKLISMGEIKTRLNEIDWNKKVIFYCRSGVRSLNIARQLPEEKDVYNLVGGINAVLKIGVKDLLDFK